MLLALFVSLPFMALIYQAWWVVDATPVWSHLVEHLLADYVINSLLMLLGVGLGVLCIGVVTAWLVVKFRFPASQWFDWLLLLPLAMPAYIIAYTYTGILDFAGPVQTYLRSLTGWHYGDYWFWQVRSLSGVIVLLSLVLYPYVYLSVRAALLSQGGLPVAVARSLGASRWEAFWRVSLPLIRPALIAGLSLALMETLADYGTVQFFGVDTFTTGIFRTFYGLGSLSGAAQLALLLLLFVLVLLLFEHYSRRRMQFYFMHTGSYEYAPQRLRGWRAWAATMICLLPVLLGFLIPLVQLVWWTVIEATIRWQDFSQLVWHSFSLASISALLVVFLAIMLGYVRRYTRHPAFGKFLSVTRIGYALPGTVIALGVLIPFASLDAWINQTLAAWHLTPVGLIFSGTLFMLVTAYSVRFLPVAAANVDAGLGQIAPSIDRVGKSLGHSGWSVLTRVHLPMIRISVLTAFMLVFVDILKELPATLMLRPFDFNTLAVRAYELAADEQLSAAAPAAVTIVLVGILPLWFVNRMIRQVATKAVGK